jgi:hypothetical protein
VTDSLGAVGLSDGEITVINDTRQYLITSTPLGMTAVGRAGLARDGHVILMFSKSWDFSRWELQILRRSGNAVLQYPSLVVGGRPGFCLQPHSVKVVQSHQNTRILFLGAFNLVI